jgi:tetratricopeptide (TPR) repeat protein
MSKDNKQRALYRRLRKASDADQPALTLLLGRRYVNRYPECGHGWLLLGIALVEQARYEEAERALLRSLDLYPADKRWIVLGHLGHLFKQSGNYRKAAKWYKRQIIATPDAADGYIYLGAALARSGRLAEAEAVHRRGTECIEGCIDEAFLNLGLVLRALQRYAEAAECFREAIRLDPNYDAAKDALRDVELCVKLNARSPD